LIILLACPLAGVFVSIAHVGPLSGTTLNCLLSDGIITQTKLGLRIYQNSHAPAGIDPLAAQGIANAAAAGFYVAPYIELCRGLNATNQINSLTDIISQIVPIDAATLHKSARVWLKVEPSVNPDCDWAGYSHTDNCNFLIEAINAVNNLPSTAVGVDSTANIWKAFFGSTCDSIGTSGPLLSYARYGTDGHVTSTKSYDDFVPFGGWTVAGGKIFKKMIAGNHTVSSLCGNPALHAFVDMSWGAV
jgi:hypothetical protein